MQETPVRFLGQENAGEEIGYPLQYSWASPVAQMVKNLSVMWKTWVRTLGWEDPLEKGKTTPLQYFGLENPMDSQSQTPLSNFHFSLFYFPQIYISSL